MDEAQQGNGEIPHSEPFDSDRFFTGGGRGAVLDDLVSAFVDGVDIVTLIGDEGSGKTVICEMLMEKIGRGFQCVYLPEVKGSFGDIARLIANSCDFPFPPGAGREAGSKALMQLAADLRNRGESLLLVVDGAENMFLATLERVRKILDDVNKTGGGLQLLFSGRKPLRANMEQLALCDFEDIREKQFFLSALDDDDTWSYLNSCFREDNGEADREIFSREAAAKIASMGRGNMRMINGYARESLLSSGGDTSFMVLLEHVKDDISTRDIIPGGSSGLINGLQVSWKAIAGAGAVAIILIIVLVFAGGKEKPAETDQESGSSEEMTVPSNVEVVSDSTEVVIKEQVIKDRKVQGSDDSDNDTGGVATVGAAGDSVKKKTVAVEQSDDIAVSNELAGVPVLRGTSKILVQKKDDEQVEIAPVEIREPPAPDDVLAVPTRAGNEWIRGKYSTSFSIQIMSLRSEHAEDNLRRILSGSEYQSVLDKLVILKHSSDPPTVLVFYGLYSTMTSARNARNNMPIFLRDRHPYPVSVRGAVEKVRSN